MTFTHATATCLRKYVTFQGRATRSEYWWFYLATLLVSLVTTLLDLGLERLTGFAFLNGVAGLALFLPSLSAAVRRLHDSGLSGWWLLLPFFGSILGVFGFFVGLVLILFGDVGGVTGDFPAAFLVLMVVAGLVLLVSVATFLWLLLRRSTPGPNRFGYPEGPSYPQPAHPGAVDPTRWHPGGSPYGGAAPDPRLEPGPER